MFSLPRLATRPLLLATALLLPLTAAQAQMGGKLFAKSGDWEVRKFPGYCYVHQGFDGDRAFRLSSSPKGVFTFGFMGEGVGDGAPGSKVTVTYWFGNSKRNRFTRVAQRTKMSVAENGGTMFFVITDPAREPSHAGDFTMASSVNFSYTINGEKVEETFDLRNLPKAYEKLWECSGG